MQECRTVERRSVSAVFIKFLWHPPLLEAIWLLGGIYAWHFPRNLHLLRENFSKFSFHFSQLLPREQLFSSPFLLTSCFFLFLFYFYFYFFFFLEIFTPIDGVRKSRERSSTEATTINCIVVLTKTNFGYLSARSISTFITNLFLHWNNRSRWRTPRRTALDKYEFSLRRSGNKAFQRCFFPLFSFFIVLHKRRNWIFYLSLFIRSSIAACK